MTSEQMEICRLKGIIESQSAALAHWRRCSDQDNGFIGRLMAEDLQGRVKEWVVSRIGAGHMHSKERAMRLLEEAVELCQAEGIPEASVMAQTRHVFNRPAGEPVQEAGGVAVCLLAWCASMDTNFREVALREVERIESKPVEEIRGSLARKADADLFTVDVAAHQPFHYDPTPEGK